jgi:hypothetical protein
VVALMVGVTWLIYKKPPPEPPILELTDEVKDYIRNLKLSQVDMTAHSTFLQQKVVEITGKITNTGDRAVQIVEITCVFSDPYGRPVHRERVQIVNAKMGGLKPGETKAFRLPFENLPGTWNQVMPQLVIAGIKFS